MSLNFKYSVRIQQTKKRRNWASSFFSLLAKHKSGFLGAMPSNKRKKNTALNSHSSNFALYMFNTALMQSCVLIFFQHVYVTNKIQNILRSIRILFLFKLAIFLLFLLDVIYLAILTGVIKLSKTKDREGWWGMVLCGS